MRCFYCGCPMDYRTRERDHFPVPARHGGEIVVDACIACHDLKDRIPFAHWSPDDQRAVIDGIGAMFAHCPRGHESRMVLIAIGKFVAMACDAESRPGATGP